ncbi:MAG: hypothetical protein IPK13_05935 [Deltaproteobacteria bacterium]|nr:hypothetical protein [Deltaproteobacteria bacterium]
MRKKPWLWFPLVGLLSSCVETVSRELPPLEGSFAVIIIDPADSTKPKRYMVRTRSELEELPIVAEPGDIYVLDYACDEMPCQLKTKAVFGADELRKREGEELLIPKSNRIYSAHISASGSSAWSSFNSWPPPPLVDYDVPKGENQQGWCACEASVDRVRLTGPGKLPDDFGFASPVGEKHVAVSLVYGTATQTSTTTCEGFRNSEKATSFFYIVRIPEYSDPQKNEQLPATVFDETRTEGPIKFGSLTSVLVSGETEEDLELLLLNRYGEFHSFAFNAETGVLTSTESALANVDLEEPKKCFQQSELSTANGDDLFLLTRNVVSDSEKNRTTTARLRYLKSREEKSWKLLDSEESTVYEKIRPRIVWVEDVAFFTGYDQELTRWEPSSGAVETVSLSSQPLPRFVSGIAPVSSDRYLVVASDEGDQPAQVFAVSGSSSTHLLSTRLKSPINDVDLFDRVLFANSYEGAFQFYSLARAEKGSMNADNSEICKSLGNPGGLISISGDMHRAFRLRDRIVRVYEDTDGVWWVDFLRIHFGVDQLTQCEF